MALINFNLPKSRRFNYRPVYYDERKERLEEMKTRAKAELEAEKKESGYVGGLQRGFLTERRVNSKRGHLAFEKKSTLRFLIILLALLGIFYLWQPEIFMAFWRIK